MTCSHTRKQNQLGWWKNYVTASFRVYCNCHSYSQKLHPCRYIIKSINRFRKLYGGGCDLSVCTSHDMIHTSRKIIHRAPLSCQLAISVVLLVSHILLPLHQQPTALADIVLLQRTVHVPRALSILQVLLQYIPDSCIVIDLWIDYNDNPYCSDIQFCLCLYS